jgi:transcriptional regulator of acetoin/glycerol metabolism
MIINFRRPVDDGYLCLLGEDGHVRPWADLQREVLENALVVNAGQIKRTASELKIARSTLYRFVQERNRKA